MKMTYLLGALFLLQACNTQKADNNTSTLTDKEIMTRTDTVYIVRNADITPANSYSDLFLDSTAIAQFLQTRQVAADDQRGYNSFYNYRNLQFAWFTSQGLTEQAKGFWNLQDELGTKADKSLRNKMDTLLNMDTLVISRFDTSVIQTELALTKAYLDFYKANRGNTQFASLAPEKAIPVKKQPVLALADTLLMQRADTSATRTSPAYQQLRQHLKTYTDIARKGGWQNIPSARQIKKGASSPTVALIKKRLQLTGEWTGTDTSAIYSDSLVTAIQAYQSRHGMKPTGIITDSLVRSLNVPVETRIQQLIINLQRMQWMPVSKDANYITVNIPSYLLTVYENNAKVFDMPVAVGKEGTSTTMFTGDLNQVVFSPHWNIPASIVKNEIVPKMQADKNYLKSRNMEIVGKNDSLPVIRQLPGKDNALGRVKFLFPNRYDIYFHDTYNKEVFNAAKRAVSHGCIRLQDAEKLANYLLRNKSDWTQEKIRAAMNANKEQYVKVDPAVPVVVSYYTAWVDENGQLQFRDDLYGNDSKVMQMMFEAARPAIVANATDTLVKKDTVRKRK